MFAQAAAGLHELQHVTAYRDSAGLPGPHTQFCVACAAFAAIGSAATGASGAFEIADLGVDYHAHAQADSLVEAQPPAAFRSRAPPR
jgi:hypothetical protein